MGPRSWVGALSLQSTVRADPLARPEMDPLARPLATKTRRERVVALDRAGGHLDVPLFASDHKRAFRNAATRAGIARITLRDLRHCHATWAAQGTGDAAAAQAALGHADLRTTQRYLTATLARVSSAAVAVGEMVAAPAPAPGPLAERLGHSFGAQSGCPVFRSEVLRVETVGFEPTTPCVQTHGARLALHASTCRDCFPVLFAALSICLDLDQPGHGAGHGDGQGEGSEFGGDDPGELSAGDLADRRTA